MVQRVEKRIALTFDDGPNPPYTSRVIDILRDYSIPATFFVCGANIERTPRSLRQISDNGYQIGNHSYHHRFVPTLLGVNLLEILATQRLIRNNSGEENKLFRAPFGIAPFWLNLMLKLKGFKIAPLGVMGFDWQAQLSSEQITNNITNAVLRQGKLATASRWPEARLHHWLLDHRVETHPWHIILLHDGNGGREGDRSKTVEALPKILDRLLVEGYDFAKLEY